MNVTFFSNIPSQISQIPPSSLPHTLLHWYIRYLWYYDSNSWVARIAYSCRVLALFISLPVIILGLLDITSYAIARTLGVVDDVRASTSDKPPAPSQPTPAISVRHPPISPKSKSDSFSVQNMSRNDISSSALDESIESLNVSGPLGFYATGSEGNLKLSGVGVFSPAASAPPSPTASRYNSLAELGELENEAEGAERSILRHRTQKIETEQ
ncbi:hypothetical protein BDQ17DRAFT_1387777 [Cyathus striatus]|nr:hypothetical protein BDQ17DRAFT_1387777 [Cyathus striatus]